MDKDALDVVDDSYRREFHELFDAHFRRLEARMDGLEARVDAKLERLKAELLRWMFLFRVGTMGTVPAIVKLEPHSPSATGRNALTRLRAGAADPR